MNIEDGGPAFPETRWDDKSRQEVQWTGMSLRDYFAAQAMAGILGGDHPICHEHNPLPTVAKVAYEMADAMLKARQA